MEKGRLMNSDDSVFCRGERGSVSSCKFYEPNKCSPYVNTCKYAFEQLKKEPHIRPSLDVSLGDNTVSP